MWIFQVEGHKHKQRQRYDEATIVIHFFMRFEASSECQLGKVNLSTVGSMETWEYFEQSCDIILTVLQEDNSNTSVLKMNSRKDRLEAERAEANKRDNEC